MAVQAWWWSHVRRVSLPWVHAARWFRRDSYSCSILPCAKSATDVVTSPWDPAEWHSEDLNCVWWALSCCETVPGCCFWEGQGMWMPLDAIDIVLWLLILHNIRRTQKNPTPVSGCQAKMPWGAVTLNTQNDNPSVVWSCAIITFTTSEGALSCPLVPTSSHCAGNVV